MPEINILHLSDLHMSSGKRLSSTSKNLIKDIVEQTSNMDNLIMVVSGDIIDKGVYEKNKEGVINFFRNLQKAIGEKIIATCFVPGNHDKVHSAGNILYGKLCHSNEIEITDEIWKLQRENYEPYLGMVSDIKCIFNSKSKKVNETFNIETVEIKNDIICIIEMDTTWAACGEEEEGKLVLGKYQLDVLTKQYEEIKEKLEETDKHISLTIGVGHHPISWLKPSQEKIIKKYMTDEEYLNMDLYLCGHIHEMNLENWQNNEHSIMTLVTGIGWNHHRRDNKEKDKKDEHRYSIYIIDIEKNSCDIIMRRSQSKGDFVRDYSVYVGDNEKPNKLCFPLKLRNNAHPFIELNAPKDDLNKSIFVDKDMLNLIVRIHNLMMLFEKKSTELIKFYERGYIENLEEKYSLKEMGKVKNYFFNGEQLNEEVEKIFNDNLDDGYRKFTAFLQDLLVNFVDIFQSCFPKDSHIRVHFRWYKKDDDEYKRLCQYSNLDNLKGPSISDIKWGGLIEQAYILKKSLIYSANAKYNNHRPVKWDDFITIVPLFYKCEEEFKNIQGKKLKRPMMTFGISVTNEKCEKICISKNLYVMEFLDIYQMITNVLDDFISAFALDYTKYLTYINNR